MFKKMFFVFMFVWCMMRFDTLPEAIRFLNDTKTAKAGVVYVDRWCNPNDWGFYVVYQVDYNNKDSNTK
jgi:hypothetical protein